jgi:hypothetical protein
VRDEQFCPRRRGIVLSPARIVVDRISFRQVASVTWRWQIAAKLRSRRHDGTPHESTANYAERRREL